MADFTANLQTLNHSLSENSNLEMINNFNALENLNSHCSFSDHQLQLNITQNDNGSFANLSSSLNAEIEHDENTKNLGGRKRKRKNERNLEKLKEVVHVRAKRGQATDSHSLAERVRREKINNRLKSLQDLVPGCYKTMGMAVMLDVIIKYVQSLQNQIEFLSMKLAAACMHSDFSLADLDGMDKTQETNGYEVQEIERIIQSEEHQQLSQFPWPPHL